ncbi:MAG: serine/threonine protein kinase [Anaerolineae bacterium]|nr:serine/threonine protein kinase [Anaerolineae bacterium]
MTQAPTDQQRFGPFIIGEKIGSGGMAVVYKALNTETKRRVALKVLRSMVAENPAAVERFQQEATIATRLKHPHVVQIHSHGQLRGRHYLEMQFMAGGTLQQRLQNPTELSVQEAIRLLRHVASALDYAHSQGVIHRDLKLENILLDDRGNAALGDFGIARAADSANLTATGMMIGTPLYLSPEQILGNPHDFRADLYGMGIIAYVLTVGQYPFNGEKIATILNAHVTIPAPTPSNINPQIPKSVDAVLLKALAKHPEERYPSADMLVEALARAFERAEIRSTHIDLTNSTSVLKIEAAKPAVGKNVDELVQQAEASSDKAQAIKLLRQALELEPLHSKANRMLFQLEGAKPLSELRSEIGSGKAAVASGVALPSIMEMTNILPEKNKTGNRKTRRNIWTWVGIGAFILSTATIVFFILSFTGSPLAGQIANFLQGIRPVDSIDGTPIAQVPDAVLQVEPAQTKTMGLDDVLNGVLDAGIAHEYRFQASYGNTIYLLTQFVSPEARSVSRNVAIIDAQGQPAVCDRQRLLDGDNGVIAICNVRTPGEWKLRVLGIQGESTGAYFVSYKLEVPVP